MDIVNVIDVINEIENLTKYDSALTEKCSNLTQAVAQKQTTMHIIVGNLKNLLVHTSAEKRELGTLVLSLILENLSKDFLSSTELHFISSFYADRLKDHHQVIPAVLRGLFALVQMTNLPEGAPWQLLNALFENVPCQQQQQKDRQYIFSIFKEILNKRATEIKAIGIDFSLGVIQAIDGEKDPRNLLLLFNWLPQFLQTVPLGHLTEEMFEVIACYFPVDFRAPGQDANGVTRENLADALCPCLCAIPEFAQYCIPLLIEKLNSTLKIAKYDSINLLTESCKIFDVSIYEQHSNDIWSILQKEILNLDDAEIEEASLNAIAAVINRLSQSENKSFFKDTISNLYDTLRGNLRPDTKLFIPSSKILLAVARASTESCSDIVQKTVSLLLNQFNITKDSTHQEILFRTLMEFVIAYIKLFEVTNIMEIKVLQEIPALCLQSYQHTEAGIRVISFESLSKIAKTLPLNVREKVYELLKIAIVLNDQEHVRNAILKCFKTYATIYKDEVSEKILSSKLDVNNINVLELYLDTISVIAANIYFTDFVIPQILENCTSESLAVAKISLKSLRKLLVENSDNEHIHNYLYQKCETISKLTAWVLNLLKENKTDFELLDDVSNIMKNLVGYQTKEEQQLIIKNYVNDLLTNYKVNGCLNEKIIILLEGFLLRLRPGVDISNKYQLIQELVQLSSSVDQNTYLFACKLIANILNKCPEDENFLNILSEIENYTSSNLVNNENNLHIQNLIQLISWITKSLVIKGSNKSDMWTDMLIILLNNYEEAGKSFQLIMDDSQDCLSSKSYCINRLLYRQKFFAYVCKKLSNSYNENTPNHLIAIGYLLQLAPQQVIILYFKEALRLLIFCLELCKNTDVLCAVLNTLCTLIKNKEPYLEHHIGDLLPRFLELTKFESSMKVRIASLKCIQEFSSDFPLYKLLPHKQTIIFGLSAALDDKKRLVRKQAVETRLHWFLLDAPS